jgi:hypothetical protein
MASRNLLNHQVPFHLSVTVGIMCVTPGRPCRHDYVRRWWGLAGIFSKRRNPLSHRRAISESGRLDLGSLTMPQNTKTPPQFESLLLVSKNLKTDDVGYEFELGPWELAGIGHVIVHWAFLEAALLYRTKAFAKRARVSVPRDAHNFSFTRRLRVLRELMLMATRDTKAKKRWENLISRIANAEGRRHEITHGLWSYDPTQIERLWAHDRRGVRADNFDFRSLHEFGSLVGQLSYELMNPLPDRGRPPKDRDGPFAYASRRFRLMLAGKDPADLGFPQPIRVTPEHPQGPSEE